MLNIHTLKAETRTVMGTGSTRELRRKHMVPAIIYGAGKPQITLALSEKDITLQYRKQGFMSHMFDIEVGNKKFRALPKAIQLHPVTDEIEHMDFIHVNENEKIKINITISFTNEARCPGIKQGGTLNIVRHNLEIFCLPKNIPENITVNVGELGLGQTIHVSDLSLPEGVETKLDAHATIAAITGGKATDAEAEEAGADKK